MLQIIFMILKILGILLLVVLGVILTILLLVLFLPLRYRCDVEFDGRPKGKVQVSWLLHLVTVRVNYDGTVKALVKILWFRLFDKSVWPEEESMPSEKADEISIPEEYMEQGFVTGKELTDLMANAKLLIAPSVCYENNPLSILEAHSMGVPVVTMNHGGMAELVEDGKTGVLASSKAPDSLAEAVKKCLDNTEYYETLKTNCEKISDNIMDVTEYTDILIEQYNNLIDKR